MVDAADSKSVSERSVGSSPTSGTINKVRNPSNMNMFIPEIGTRIILSEDWMFTLYFEQRNKFLIDFMDAVNDEADMSRRRNFIHGLGVRHYADDREGVLRMSQWYQDRGHDMNALNYQMTLPVGTDLTIDRIYIRKGQENFSSASFVLNHTAHPVGEVRGRKRFWAKLEDVNNIVFELAR